MFSPGHFIWLAVTVVLITASIILIKKFKVPDRIVDKVVLVLLVVLKVFHMALSMIPIGDDGEMILKPNQLSFHLCSIQIYLVIFINIIKNEKTIANLKSFMVPCMVIGALMSLLIPTEGVDPTVPRVWQYMLIHMVLIFYGFYLMLVQKVDLSFKAYVRNIGFLLICTLLAMLMNTVLQEYGVNFMFLRKPPMKDLPILNLDNGWYIYFLTLMGIALTLVALVQLPFMIKKKKDSSTLEEVK